MASWSYLGPSSSFHGWVARGDGTMSPLIAADELPFPYKLANVPRSLPLDPTLDLAVTQHRGHYVEESLPSALRQYSEAPLMDERPSSMASYSEQYKPHGPAGTGKQPYAREFQGLERQDPLAGSGYPTMPHAPYQGNIRAPNEPELPPSGVRPDAGKKEYCTHWLTKGTCAFMSQGCKFKHEVPDRETLRAIGLVPSPHWQSATTSGHPARNRGAPTQARSSRTSSTHNEHRIDRRHHNGDSSRRSGIGHNYRHAAAGKQSPAHRMIMATLKSAQGRKGIGGRGSSDTSATLTKDQSSASTSGDLPMSDLSSPTSPEQRARPVTPTTLGPFGTTTQSDLASTRTTPVSALPTDTRYIRYFTDTTKPDVEMDSVDRSRSTTVAHAHDGDVTLPGLGAAKHSTSPPQSTSEKKRNRGRRSMTKDTPPSAGTPKQVTPGAGAANSAGNKKDDDLIIFD